MGDLQFYLNVAVTGMSIGAVYALFGQGITMIWKATRVPNFAHAAVGTVGAYVFVKCWDRTNLQEPWLNFKVPFTDLAWHPDPPALPLVLAILAALVVTGLLGLVIEKVVMRPLAGAPTLNLIIVTVALFSLLLGLSGDIFGQRDEAVPSVFPEGSHAIGGVNFSNNALGIFIVTTILAAGLGVFFKRSALGIAIRATADSREVSRLLGISADRVAGFAWAVGSMLAAVAGILIASGSGLSPAGLSSLIVYGFAASLVGGFTSLVGTLLGGLFIGVASNLVSAAPWPAGILQELFGGKAGPTLVTLALIVGLLMVRPKFIFAGVRLDEDTGVSFARAAGGINPEDQARRDLDRAGQLELLLRDWKRGRYILGVLIVVPLLIAPLFLESYYSGVFADGVIVSIIALSVVVLTGWTGQISLAPLTFMGIGAYGTAIATTSWHLPVPLALLAGGLVTVPFSLLLGIPALRLRGFFLALTTLAFAFFGEGFLFVQPTLLDRNVVTRGWFGDEYNQPIFYVALGVAVLLFLGARNLSRTRVARAFHALRDSELTAQVMGINPVGYKLLAFSVAGFIAGTGGALFAFLHPRVQGFDFALFFSLALVLQAVVSGVGVLFGAALAGAMFEAIPQLMAQPTSGTNQAPIILAGALAISTIIQNPNGFGGYLARLVRPFDQSERVAWASADAGRAAVQEDDSPLTDPSLLDEEHHHMLDRLHTDGADGHRTAPNDTTMEVTRV